MLEQALALKAMDCDSLQGYYFSRPVAVDAVAALLGQRWTLDAANACQQSSPGTPTRPPPRNAWAPG